MTPGEAVDLYKGMGTPTLAQDLIEASENLYRLYLPREWDDPLRRQLHARLALVLDAGMYFHLNGDPTGSRPAPEPALTTQPSNPASE